MSKSYDIAVIGGGPSGSTAASLLAKKGYNVILFEKEKFPRAHVGESLLPFCYPIFEELGVLEEMKKRFVRKPGACFATADGQEETTYCFKNVVDSPMHLSFHVRRAEFDKLLLDNSKKIGVEVKEEYKVKKIDLSNPNQVKINVLDNNNISHDYNANFILDASGRDSFISNKMKTRQPMKDFNRSALHAHWKVDKMPKELESGMVRINYTGGEKKGWIWTIPNDVDQISIGVVLETKYLNEQRKKLAKSNHSDWINDIYIKELSYSSIVNNMISNSKLNTQVWVNADYSYYSTQKYGSNFAMIGDSGQFIDPIFASGVFIAMKTAEIVSKAVSEKLKKKNQDALNKAYIMVKDGYETVSELINIYYNPEILNFANLGTNKEEKNKRFSDFKGSYALLHYLLAGDFFEKGHIYKDFFKSLRDEKKFSKWQNFVKFDKEESGVFHHHYESCETTKKEVFGDILA